MSIFANVCKYNRDVWHQSAWFWVITLLGLKKASEGSRNTRMPLLLEVFEILRPCRGLSKPPARLKRVRASHTHSMVPRHRFVPPWWQDLRGWHGHFSAARYIPWSGWWKQRAKTFLLLVEKRWLATAPPHPVTADSFLRYQVHWVRGNIKWEIGNLSPVCLSDGSSHKLVSCL